MNETQSLMSAKEAARQLGVSRATVSRLLAAKKLGYFRIGIRTLFSQQHLDDFLTSVEQPASKDELRR